MAPTPSIAAHLERHSVLVMESTIPPGVTIAQYRRQRSAPAPAPPAPCDHLHDSTTRYDHVEKQLSFLLVCPVCGTERIVETQSYEPRFDPHPAAQPADDSGATVHQLPVRTHQQPERRAA